jgi:hypothetical protein
VAEISHPGDARKRKPNPGSHSSTGKGPRDLLGPLRDSLGIGHIPPSLHSLLLDDAQEYYDVLSEAPGERRMLAWLKRHPYVLLHAIEGGGIAIERVGIFAEVPLGEEFRIDFAVLHADSDGARWTFIELESPRAPLFTKAGNPSQALVHGLRQIDDWNGFIKDNESYVKKRFARWHEAAGVRGPVDSWRSPDFLVVIGREQNLTQEARRRKASMNDVNPRRQIATYDRLDPHRWDRERLGIFDVAKERGATGAPPWPEDSHPWRVSPPYLDAIAEARRTGKPTRVKSRSEMADADE